MRTDHIFQTRGALLRRSPIRGLPFLIKSLFLEQFYLSLARSLARSLIAMAVESHKTPTAHRHQLVINPVLPSRWVSEPRMSPL